MGDSENQINIEWLKASLNRIEKKVDRIGTQLDNHEKRISHLEGINKFWIPTLVGLMSVVVGILIGHVGL